MELEAEIFAVGKWNGMTFDAADLQGMADSFNRLKDNLKVGLKIGHTAAQTMANGQHALGWVDKVWIAGDKLMARFTDMPDVVYKAMQKKLYRNVSVEMDVDVQYKNEQYPYVLTGVALLGVDIPAVNTLKDLTHYMGRDAAFSVGRRAVFSAIAGITTPKENSMELAELTKKVAELTASIATFTTDNATLKAENAVLAIKVAKFEADASTAIETANKLRIEAKRKTVADIFEEGVKSEGITPAQRENFSKVLRISDDTALDALDIEQVKALVPAGKKTFGRTAKEGGQQSTDLRPDQQVAKEIAELQAANSSLSFSAAQKVVFDRNPELAQSYAHANDKE